MPIQQYSKALARTPALLELIDRITENQKFGFDTESSGPRLVKRDMCNMYLSTTTGFSVAVDGQAFYVPLRHNEGNAPLEKGLQLLDVLKKRSKIAHSVKHELTATEDSYDNIGKWEDTQILAWLLQDAAPGKSPYGVKALAAHHLSMEMATFKETVGKDRVFADMDPAAHETVSYACDDAIASLELYKLLYPRLAEYNLEGLFHDHEMPFICVLHHMEHTGMCIDAPYLTDLAANISSLTTPLMEEWDFLTGGLNIRSSKQLQSLFANGEWVGVEANPKSGTWKTNKASMALVGKTELGKRLAQIKSEFALLDKIKGTYADPLVAKAAQYPDGRLHPEFHHTGTVTGRLSCEDPNLENIPARTESGRRILKAFLAPPGYRIISADYSQLELRILAHFLGRGDLYNAFHGGRDPHQETAGLLGVERDIAKNINFALIYGAGDKKLAAMCGLDIGETKGILRTMEQKRPEIGEVQAQMVAAGKRRGFIKTILGRFRKVPEVYSSSKKEQWRGERILKNTPIQGSAADIVKAGMLRFFNYLRKNNELSRVQICNQVHDDVPIYAKNEIAEPAARQLKESLELAATLRVPLQVDPKIGGDWAELKAD